MASQIVQKIREVSGSNFNLCSSLLTVGCILNGNKLDSFLTAMEGRDIWAEYSEFRKRSIKKNDFYSFVTSVTE